MLEQIRSAFSRVASIKKPAHDREAIFREVLAQPGSSNNQPETQTGETPVANALVTEFEKIGSWFKSIFKKLPAWNVIAMSALNVAAPLVETIVDLADPAAGAILTPILTSIQAKFGQVASLIGQANTNNLSSTLTSIVDDLPTLLSVANIKDAASVEKATAAVTSIVSELQAILAAIPGEAQA